MADTEVPSTQTLSQQLGPGRALPANTSTRNGALLPQVRCESGAHRREVLKLRSKSSRIASMNGMVFRYCSGVTLVVPCTHIAKSCGPHASDKRQPAATGMRLPHTNSSVSCAPALEARLLRFGSGCPPGL